MQESTFNSRNGRTRGLDFYTLSFSFTCYFLESLEDKLVDKFFIRLYFF